MAAVKKKTPSKATKKKPAEKGDNPFLHMFDRWFAEEFEPTSRVVLVALARAIYHKEAMCLDAALEGMGASHEQRLQALLLMKERREAREDALSVKGSFERYVALATLLGMVSEGEPPDGESAPTPPGGEPKGSPPLKAQVAA